MENFQDHLPYDVHEGEPSDAQTRVFDKKGTTQTSIAVLNQGTKPIIAVASKGKNTEKLKTQQNQDFKFKHNFKDGSIKLRKLRRSIENRLEIEDNVLTSWKISSGDRTDIRQKNDTRIIWNEEILTCSGNDT